jgi:hypothetical protein
VPGSALLKRWPEAERKLATEDSVEFKTTTPESSVRKSNRKGPSRACHGSGHRLDCRRLGEKASRAASCSVRRQMLRGMAKVSISLRS